jgi:Transposase
MDSPTKTQVEVITSVQRRRRWPRAEKERIVAAAMEPGAVASEVARAAGVHASQFVQVAAAAVCAIGGGAGVLAGGDCARIGSGTHLFDAAARD